MANILILNSLLYHTGHVWKQNHKATGFVIPTIQAQQICIQEEQ